jgi:TonB-linked SusC/RagA family outer membrane protein
MRKAFTLFVLLFTFLGTQIYAQNRTITGKVISSQDNLGIPGVSVVVAGTTNGTVTDIDGNYTLSIAPETKTLHFSAVGMKAKDVEVGATDKIDVTLDQAALKLDEVVVTANAIVREKRSLGYATTQVNSDELTSGENRNVIGALQGKVSGVNITSLSGAPGSAQRVVIRGGTSLTRNNQALFVIDGVPMDNSNLRPHDPNDPDQVSDDLNNQVDYGSRGNDINPDDIESISVLKGPAAAALYGSRASNGAIMITTKSGKRKVGGKGGMDVTFHSNVTFASPLKLPEFQNEFGQGDLDNIEDDRRENFSWGLPFDGKYRPWGQEINGQQRIKPYSAIENNMRDFFDVGTTYNNNVSFSGGTEKSAYYLSVGATNSKGIVPTTTFDKYNIRFNGSSELTNHFSTTFSVNFSSINRSDPAGGQQSSSVYDNLLQNPRDIPIVDGKNLDDPYNSYNDITGTYGYYGAYALNPYFVVNNFKNTNDVDRLIASTSVTYSNWDWLSITDRLGGDIYGDRRYQKWKKYDYAPADESGLYVTPNNNQTYQGRYSEDVYNFNSFNNDLMLTFKKKITEDISATLLVGQNIRQQKLNNIYSQTNEQGGLILEGYYNLQNSNGTPVSRNTLNETRNIGYYGDLNLAYKSMVFLGLTGRRDKSSTFLENNNTYFYPSVNASFVFSELFKPELTENIWTYGKLRGSYARVGNDAPAYSLSNVYASTNIASGFGSTVFPLRGVPGFSVYDKSGNPDLTPEFTKAAEVGLELGFLKDRLTVDFSYYANKSTDQIFPLTLPSSSGFTSKTVNEGEIKNSGIELALRGIVLNNKSGFKIELFGTYTKNNSKVVSLYGGVDRLLLGGFEGMGIYAQVGKPYGAFEGVDLLKDANGHVIIDTSSGLPSGTPNEVYLGTYQPDYMASLGANMSYKGFTLHFLFDTKQGGKFFSRTKSLMDFLGTAKETTVNGREDYIWPESVHPDANGNLVANSDITFHPYDYWTSVLNNIPGQHVLDATYVKLREVSFSYDFPNKWLSHSPFGSASLTVFGNNLFIWTPKENQYADPEQNSAGASNTQGFEYSPNVSQRNYGVDLKFTF